MRQALAKGQRREIRRAFGAAALATLGDQEQATGLLANSLRGLRAELSSLELDHATFKRDMLSELPAALETLSDQREILAALTAVRDRGFFGRLRWLVLGR